jgi:hypothetical protein
LKTRNISISYEREILYASFVIDDQVKGAGQPGEPGLAAGPGADGEAGAGCAFCGGPMPPPRLDASGRRKAGRPARFCRKACADAASRARRERHTSVVAAHLAAAARLHETAGPGIEALTATLAELNARLREAESGALAQIEEAEDEATQARAAAADAEQRAQDAERARGQALAQAAADRDARAEAERRAMAAGEETEATKRRTWEEVAGHERERGRAEAARDAAMAARDRLSAERDELADRLRTTARSAEALRAAHDEQAVQLADLRQALAERASESAVLREQATAARRSAETAESARDQARADAVAAREDATRARAAAEEHRHAAEQAREEHRRGAELAREERDRLRGETTALHASREREHSARRAAERETESLRGTLATLQAANARLTDLLSALAPAPSPDQEEPA